MASQILILLIIFNLLNMAKITLEHFCLYIYVMLGHKKLEHFMA